MTMYGEYNESESYAPETCSHLLKYNNDTHNLNYYKTVSNIIDEDRQYGSRFHV